MRKGIDERQMTLRLIEDRGGPSASTISGLLNGTRLPTRAQVAKIAEGAGVTAEQAEIWQELRDRAEEALNRLRPDLDRCRTDTDLLNAFWGLFESCGTDLDAAITLVERADADKVGPVLGKLVKPDEKRIREVFDSRSVPLTKDLLAWMVFAAGGRKQEVDHWLQAFEQVRHRYRPDPVAAAEPSATDSSSVDSPAVDSLAADSPVSKPSGGGADEAAGTPERATATDDRSPADEEVPPASRSDTPNWRRRRMLAAVAVACLLAVTGGLVVLTRRPDDPTPPPVTTPSTEHVPTPLPDRLRAASRTHDELVRLGERTALSVDASGSGPFTYIQRRISYVDTTSRDRTALTVVDEELWWMDGDAGITGQRVTRTSRPGQAPWTYREYLQPGDLDGAAEPPSTDPAVLRQQLGRKAPAHGGPARWLLAVAEVNDQFVVDVRQRVAIFDLLATVEGVTYANQGMDELGRVGLAFSADNAEGTRRETLLFDPANGVLLNHETVRLAPDPADQYVSSRTLYLERGRRSKPA